MAITTKRLYELFETKWLMQRQNPGGKSPYLQGYLLGFAGTINILEALEPVTKTGTVKLKVGNGAVQSRTVNFSTFDPAALTPSQAVQALTNAGFTGCTFSIDPETNRLKLTPTDTAVKWTQIYGDLAAALNFGGCRYAEGKGCYLWPSFDGDLKSLAETEQWGEDTTIENDSPLGTPVKYTRAGKRSGTQIVITDRMSSYAAKQMINGGKWLSGDVDQPEVYEPPVASDSEPRRMDVFTYSEVFDKNDNTEGDEIFIRERMYIGCVGHQTRTGGAGSWSDSEYTLTAATYIGDDSREHASPRETNYTQAQWETLQMSGVLVDDWENA
jgi:hypothetical protein